MKRLIVFLVGLSAAALAFGEGPRAPVKATHAIELSSPAGDVSPIHSSGGDYPGFDVVKLAIRSDGLRIAVATTLKDLRGSSRAKSCASISTPTTTRPPGRSSRFPRSAGSSMAVSSTRA